MLALMFLSNDYLRLRLDEREMPHRDKLICIQSVT